MDVVDDETLEPLETCDEVDAEDALRTPRGRKDREDKPSLLKKVKLVVKNPARCQHKIKQKLLVVFWFIRTQKSYLLHLAVKFFF